jgi:sn-glycerol 3-phosphate transport system permease protein
MDSQVVSVDEAGADMAGVASPRPARRPRFPSWVPYLLPSLLVFAVFVIYPFVKTLITSFYATSTTGELVKFVGLSNFQVLFKDTTYVRVLVNTLIYAAVTVPLTMAIALMLAVLTARDRKLMGLFRTIFSSTMGISVASAAVFWRLLYSPNSGFLNSLLGCFGLDGVGWLTDQNVALGSICAVTVWMNLGLAYLVLLGGIKNIDDSYYETVEIVGGGFWYRLRKVTVPLISPSLFFVLTISVIGAFQSFGLIDMLTSGGPNNATNLLVYRLYKDAFVNFRYGMASAEGIVLFVLIFGISLLQMKLTEKKVTYQ